MGNTQLASGAMNAMIAILKGMADHWKVVYDLVAGVSGALVTYVVAAKAAAVATTAMTVGLYITVVALLQLLQLGAHHGNGAVTQQLAGGAGALLRLAHGPEVGEDLQCGEQCDEHHQNRVEVKGDGADVDAYALLIGCHRAAQFSTVAYSAVSARA